MEVIKALDKMDLKELRRAYRVSFKIKALEPVRPLIAEKIIARGATLPRLTTGGI